MKKLNELQRALLDQILLDFKNYVERAIDNHNLDVNVTSFIEMEAKTKWKDDIDFFMMAEDIINAERKNVNKGIYSDITKEIVTKYRRLTGSSINEKILLLAGFEKENPTML